MLKKSTILLSLLFTISCGQEQPTAEPEQFEAAPLNYIESSECDSNSQCSVDKMCNPFTKKCIPLSYPSCRADFSCQGLEICSGLENLESVGKCSQPVEEQPEQESTEEEQPEQEPVEEEQPEQEPVEEEQPEEQPVEEEQPEEQPAEEEQPEEQPAEEEQSEQEPVEEEQPEEEPVEEEPSEEETSPFSGECNLEGNVYNFNSICISPQICVSRHQDNFQVIPETGFCAKYCMGHMNCPSGVCVINGITPGVGYCEE